MATAPTSGTVSRFCLISLSVRKVISFKSRGALTLTDMTGTESRSNLSTMGVSVPVGRRERMVFTLSRTSCAAASRLRSSRNCTVIRDTPSSETLLNSSMLWTVLMISSIGLVTLVSISSGDAPRSVVVTVMIGSSTLGYWSMPML